MKKDMSNYNYYIELISKYVKDNLYLYEKVTKKDIIKLLIELDDNNRLNSINHELLETAAELIHNEDEFLDYIRLLLIPKILKENNKVRYYNLLFNENCHDLSKEQITKYAHKYYNIYNCYEDFRRRNINTLFEIDSIEFNCALMIIISNYYDHNTVPNKKELYNYLYKFLSEADDFFESMQLNGINHILDGLLVEQENNELLFYSFVEYYYDNRNNKVNRRIY